MASLRTLAWALAASFLLSACATVPKSPYPWQVLNQQQMYDFLAHTNQVRCRYGLQLTWTNYAIPSARWIKDIYSPYLLTFLTREKVWCPSLPKNRCVNFSSYGLAAGLMLYQENQAPQNTTLAVGVTDYSLGLHLGHSLNAFVATDDRGQLVLLYYEPQTRQFIPTDEVASNWLSFRM